MPNLCMLSFVIFPFRNVVSRFSVILVIAGIAAEGKNHFFDIRSEYICHHYNEFLLRKDSDVCDCRINLEFSLHFRIK